MSHTRCSGQCVALVSAAAFSRPTGTDSTRAPHSDAVTAVLSLRLWCVLSVRDAGNEFIIR